jgi:hypothetical protein
MHLFLRRVLFSMIHSLSFVGVLFLSPCSQAGQSTCAPTEKVKKDLSYADFMVRSYYDTPFNPGEILDRRAILEVPPEDLNLEDPEILFMLAEAHVNAGGYWDSKKKAQHMKKASEYYTKAANLGHSTSWRRLGSNIYWESGDLKKHDEYQKKADELENPPCPSGEACTVQSFKTLDQWFHYVATVIQCGKEKEKWEKVRQEEAWKLLQGLGEFTDPKLQFYKGVFYEKGIGTPKDLEKARIFYEKAYEGGFAKAAYRLGLLYHKKNKAKAHYYFEKACEMGFKLGCIGRYTDKTVDEFDNSWKKCEGILHADNKFSQLEKKSS